MVSQRLNNQGVTLIETVVFLVVVSIALVALLRVYGAAVSASVDPVIQIRALEKAQAQMDEVLARKFDENTPTGGVPACDSSAGTPCAGIVADADYDDVGDFNGYSDTSEPNYTVGVSVVNAGSEIGITNTNARRITVVVSMPGGDSVTLSAYKVNF